LRNESILGGLRVIHSILNVAKRLISVPEELVSRVTRSTYHIMTPPKLALLLTDPMIASRASAVIYPDPAAAVDPGTPTKILTFWLADEEAQLDQVS
jgi:hypothetical protein